MRIVEEQRFRAFEATGASSEWCTDVFTLGKYPNVDELALGGAEWDENVGCHHPLGFSSSVRPLCALSMTNVGAASFAYLSGLLGLRELAVERRCFETFDRSALSRVATLRMLHLKWAVWMENQLHVPKLLALVVANLTAELSIEWCVVDTRLRRSLRSLDLKAPKSLESLQ